MINTVKFNGKWYFLFIDLITEKIWHIPFINNNDTETLLPTPDLSVSNSKVFIKNHKHFLITYYLPSYCFVFITTLLALFYGLDNLMKHTTKNAFNTIIVQFIFHFIYCTNKIWRCFMFNNTEIQTMDSYMLSFRPLLNYFEHYALILDSSSPENTNNVRGFQVKESQLTISRTITILLAYANIIMSFILLGLYQNGDNITSEYAAIVCVHNIFIQGLLLIKISKIHELFFKDN